MKKALVIAVLVFVATFSFGQSSIAHINSQKIMDTMPSYKAAEQEVLKFEEKAIKELQETQQQLQGDFAKYEQEKTSMSPTAAKFEENRLRKKSQDFQTRQQELDQQIQILSQELNAPILERIQKAIEIVCEREKIAYVMDSSMLLYSNGRDITDLVAKEVLRLEREASAEAAGTNNGAE